MEKDFECYKIKDGLYLGSKIVAMDFQFLLINKFAYIINCAAQVPNFFEQHGIRYAKFKIHNDKIHPIFGDQLKRLKKMKKIIEQAQENGLCCLIHEGNGHLRSTVLVIGYLMERYKWTLSKTAQFIHSKGATIMLTQACKQELKQLQSFLSLHHVLSQNWNPPYIDPEEQILSKTFLNTPNKIKIKVKPSGKQKIIIKDSLKQQEQVVVVQKSNKHIQWQDKLDKQVKKQKKKLVGDKQKEEKKQNQKSKERLDLIKKTQAHNIIIPKQSSDITLKFKKMDMGIDAQTKKKIEEAEIYNIINKKGKINKQMIIEDIGQDEIRFNKKSIPDVEKIEINEGQQDKKVYKLTINNYINPNINIIKPSVDKKKKTSKTGGLKKEKDKINRTYSEKQTFKKATFYDKDISKEKQVKDKRNAGVTPVRSRKQRKSEKEKEINI